MPEKIKTELLIEDESGRTTVAYPFVESEHVVLENGMNIDSMIGKDISTPTTEYEELSFKVDSSAVDSSVSKMTIKGQTYQNILPEPSLRNSMKNGKSMQKFNTGYDSVNVVDGVSKSAILSGQTLVNIAPIKYAVGNISLGSEVTMKASVSDRTEEYRIKGFKPIYNLKANTKYAITVKITEMNNTSYLSSYFKFSDDTYQYGVFNNLRNVGNYIIPFTVGSKEVKEVAIYLQDNADTTISAKIKEVMLFEYQDGMENWDIPYFTGMTSCKMPVLSSIGKNLCPNIFIESNKGRVHEGNGLIYKDGYLKPSVYVSDYLDIKGISHITYNRQWNLNQDGSNGTQSYAFYDKNKNFISGYYDQTILTVPSNAHYFRITIDSEQNFQLEQGSMATAYEPYKSNILSTPSDLILGGVKDIKDTLDMTTGEKYEKTGEKIFNGSEGWSLTSDGYFTTAVNNLIAQSINTNIVYVTCDKYVGRTQNDTANLKKDGVSAQWTPNQLILRDSTVSSVAELKNKLSQSPITVRYVLATPTIKTVDLSSFGNWEKVVLNGSETEWVTGNSLWRNRLFGIDIPNIHYNTDSTSSQNVFSDNVESLTMDELCNGSIQKTGVSNYGNSIFVSVTGVISMSEFKQYLSQNPITVWYQTNTSQANSIKEMLSFANGHIQLSSGLENSLIPSIDYEVPTSNSYHMDLMKTDTKYTVKSSSASGTCDIGNIKGLTLPTNTIWNVNATNYGNGLLVVSGSWINPMIIEGDLTSKTIPYFKRIKSAFEDKDGIEVLSTGKNLFDGELELGNINTTTGLNVDNQNCMRTKNFIKVNKGSILYISSDLGYQANIYEYDANCNFIRSSRMLTDGIFAVPDNVGYLRFRTSMGLVENNLNVKFMISNDSTKQDYEPHKSNDVKIPLLSPLRSLPNGIRDEIVLDRENNKAKIIQRVGKVVLSGATHETWVKNTPLSDENFTVMHNTGYTTLKEDTIFTNLRCDKILVENYLEKSVECVSRYLNGKEFVIKIPTSKLSQPDSTGIRKWLIRNPITIYYELATPIVTEVDIEGYPYIFKDGHIFLNGEITPKTEIKYSINQSHVIESQNQDVLRHEKEIDYLYKLIGEYVRADYTSTLMTLNLELK